MTERQKIIQQMLEMQKKFIDLEQQGEFAVSDYYDADGGSEVAEYKKQFDELATRLIDLTHAEKGSHR